MTYRTKLLTLLLALGLVAAACGGGTSVSTGEGDNPFGGSSDDSSDDGSSSDDQPAADDSAGDSGDDSSDDGSSDGGGFSSAAFCAFAQEREEAESRFEEVNIFVPEEFQAAFEEQAALLDQAIDVAPDEIRGDLQIVGEDLDRVMARLAEVNFDVSALIDEPEFFDELPAAVEAGERIDDYILNECGIDPDANDFEEPSDDDVLEDLQESGNDAIFVREALVQIGIDPAAADCISQQVSIDEFAMLAEGDVPDEILSIFTSCGVSLSDLAEFGGADPDTINEGLADDLDQLEELTPEAQSLLAEELVNQGFTEGEAQCLSGTLLGEEAGGDIFLAIELCDIPLSRLAELGG